MQVFEINGFFKKIGLLPLLFLLVLSTGCSSEVVNSNSPANVQYASGVHLMKESRYLEAIDRFRMLRTRHPYSKYAALATLRIADAHYQDENYAEAAASYKLFQDLYPNHPKAAYALFQMAESYYNQVPDAIDRDLSSASDAIDAYKKFLKKFPRNKNTALAEQRLHSLREKLAEKEDYIGNFYFIRNYYRAAATRYQGLLNTYPGFGPTQRALYRLAYSYEKIGQLNLASAAISRYTSEFPKGKYFKKILALKNKISKEQ